ncbi:peritrophin-1-like [Topomyia yanbarensis]|uniref:peritrophin-1-like n=1 Tax=Topomyia yanbarensis TaxID=2498891 RepID=UPI00273C31D2|nr:peritrophin-1-like [Topomyia yanbarensis]
MKVLALLVTFGLVTGGLSSLLCPFKFDPSVTVHLPHPTDCAKYLTCVGSSPVEQYCPAGLHWNQDLNLCDYPRASRCTRGSAPQLARFNLSTIAVSRHCLPATDQCSENSDQQEDVVFLKHPDCRKFYACVSAQPVELNCPRNLYWNAESCACDYQIDDTCDEFYVRNPGGEIEEDAQVESENDGEEDVEEGEEPSGGDQESLGDVEISPEQSDQVEAESNPAQSDVEYAEPVPAAFRFRRAVNSGNSEATTSSSSDPVQSGAVEHSVVSVAVLIVTLVMSSL